MTNGWRALGLSFLAGALAALAMPPLYWLPLAIVGIVVFVWQWDASRDYDASPGLEKIRATLLAINAADDERNPPELGIMEREMQRVRNGTLLMIPGSAETRGHGTTAFAKFWKARFAQLMQAAPRLSP